MGAEHRKRPPRCGEYFRRRIGTPACRSALFQNVGWRGTDLPYTDRVKLITGLEHARDSKVVTYILSDRETFPERIPGFATALTGEPQLLFVDHLRTIGRTKQLDLFLYTRGGATDSVWPLVSLLREYCDKLTVIVPFRAHSGGTLICLGADEVIMTEIGELSPIDPTTGNQFNPTDPTNPQVRFGISVEDVAAYFMLSKERARIEKEALRIEVLKELTSKVHPLALGNVQRVYMQIRRLARRLLVLHMDERAQARRIEGIVEALTEKFYSHVHAITQTEAIPLLGNWVRPPNAAEEPTIRDLFESYSQTLELRRRFSLPVHMQNQATVSLNVLGGFLESAQLSHVYTTDLNIMQRPNLPPNVQVQVQPGTPIPLGPWVGRAFDYGIVRMGWEANNAGI